MKILLAGICKNIEQNVSIITKSFEELSRYFDCKALFYENNSCDKTSAYLCEWSNKDNRVKIITEYITLDKLLESGFARTWNNLPCRMEVIAKARNKLMEYIESDEYKDIDYVIMIDMDNPVILPVEKINEVLNNSSYNFDALICKGTNNGDMYDTYAYRDEKYPFGPEYLGEEFWSASHQNNIKQNVRNDKRDIIPVYSAFNGMAIFRRLSIKGIKYSASPTKYLDDLYRKYKHLSPMPAPIKHIDGQLQGIYLFGENGIWYKNNSGYNFPVVCEHVTFFLEMRNKGFDKIFLCNKLEWEWKR